MSEVLSHYNSRRETVAQFRERLNIVDEASEITPWDSLTEFEQSVEIFFTPKSFRYIEHIHGASEEDFGRTLENQDGEKIHLFSSSEYDDEYPYAFHAENKESFIEENLTHRNYNLNILETDWEATINYQILLARLRKPTQHNGDYFFFFG